MNTLEPFLHNRIQTTRLIEVYIVDRGHNRGIVVCKLNEPLVPLFLEESTEWHCNARGKPPNMNCSKQQPCSLQRVSRIQGSRGWANGHECDSELMLAAWPVSVSLFISISHQRSELDTYGPDAGMISAFESSRNMCKIAYPISPETCRVAVLRLLAGGGRRSSLTFNA
ncbi:hypothetical protein KCU86_g72, partial [Aureobasidium melanogenum]